MMAETEVQKIMAEHGYKLTDTGPGCTAYAKEQPGSVWIITSMEKPHQAPERMEEPVLVSRFTPAWNYIDGSDRIYDSLKDYLNGKEGKVRT